MEFKMKQLAGTCELNTVYISTKLYPKKGIRVDSCDVK